MCSERDNVDAFCHVGGADDLQHMPQAELSLQVIHMVTDLLQDDVPDVRAAADEILETVIREEPSYAEGIRTLRFEACNAQWLGSHDQLRDPNFTSETLGAADEESNSALA